MAAPVDGAGSAPSIEAGSTDSELGALVSEQELAPAGASRLWTPAALLLALACAAAGATALWQRHGSTAAVRPGVALHMSKQGDVAPDEVSYGKDKCPCIAIDQLKGHVTVDYKGVSFDYPADVGARCDAWDGDSDPACNVTDPPSWCGDPWCYVDPCNCQGLEVPPKESAYFANATFQGKPIHYSYVTCDGTDSWSSDEAKKKAQEADNKALCKKEADPTRFGDKKCQCIGVDGRNGTALITYGDTTMDYPVDVGSRCEPWEKEDDPACQVESPPGYCEMKWCYVDPCDCNLSVPSKASSYLPTAKHDGRPVHYSYVTCGAEDKWSSAEAKKQAAENAMLC